MRRFFVSLLILLMVACVAHAEVPDISGLTDEELIELETLLLSEKASRGITKSVPAGVVVPAGRYIVGEDIPAGKYILKVPELGGFEWIIFSVWEEEVDEENDPLLAHDISSNRPQYMITLSEGNIFVSDDDIRFIKFTGFEF